MTSNKRTPDQGESKPTPLTNSIEEILVHVTGRCPASHDNPCGYDWDDEGVGVNKDIESATQSIITKVKESLPEKREVTTEKTYEGYDRTNPRHRYVTGVDVGWNQAVKKMEDKLG